MLQLFQDAQEGTAHFTSLTECILTQPMLSFSLYQSHGVKKIGEEAGDENEEDDGKDVSDFDQNGLHEHDINNGDYSAADSERSAYQVSLRMFGIHTRYFGVCFPYLFQCIILISFLSSPSFTRPPQNNIHVTNLHSQFYGHLLK